MDSMDLKGIAWVGHIYQKFEAMCLEVEEAMSQETAKYVENQVQTVGAGMKRFCSDVMQDLIPPSSKELSRVASADLLLNPYLEFGIHKKPILNNKEDVIDINPLCVKGISENKSNSSNDDWVDWSTGSFSWEISDKDYENCEQMCTRALNKTSVTTVVSTKSNAKVVKRSRCISKAELADTCESSRLVLHTEATSNKSSSQYIDGDVSHTDSCENSSRQMSPQIGSNDGVNTQCGQSVGDEIISSHTGNSTDRDSNLEETKNDGSFQIMEPNGNEFESEFEDTCVLVDENDCRLDNHKEEIRRSYKKKIQNAFSLKKKPARKQEYKQLAAQYIIANAAETDIKSVEAIPLASKNIKANKLSTHDSLESEWEIL